MSGASKTLADLSPAEKRALLASLMQKRMGESVSRPLSFGQERIWFLTQLEGATPFYNMCAAFRIQGRFDPEVGREIIDEIVRRHEILRTTFGDEYGKPVQIIAPALRCSLPVVNLRHLPVAERQANLDQLAVQQAKQPFDVTRLPLFRVTLLEFGEDDHAVLVTMHHIISDGWSIRVFIYEAAALYRAFSSGLSSPLPKLSLQYSDYAVWQRQVLQEEFLNVQLSYWRKQLANLNVLELPVDFPRPGTQSYWCTPERFSLSNALATALKRFSQQEGVTLFMTLLAAFQLLLHRLTGQEDIVVGAPISGRNRAEVEGIIGFFVNALVLRTQVGGNPTFRELLGRVRQVALDAYTHQDVPFEKLVEELKPERNVTVPPLFQVLFNMNYLPEFAIDVPGLKIEPIAFSEAPSKFDLELHAREEGERIHFHLIYNSDVFSRARIGEIARQYQILLSKIIEEPDQRISLYSLLTPTAQVALPDPRLLLDDTWEGSIQALFSRLARSNPDRPAVLESHEIWNYGELDTRSNQLANYLQANGIGHHDIVVIYAARSASLVCAILGVLKVGAAFVILDPLYPADRLIDYIRLAAPRGWIQMEEAAALPDRLEEYLASLTCLCRFTLPRQAQWQAVLGDYSVANPDVLVGPADLAYMAFTSGSTGAPKGVLCRHGPVTHFLPWMKERFGFHETDRFSSLSGLAYNHLQREIFTPLYLGACVCLPDPENARSPAWLVDWMKRKAITVAHLTPAMGQLLCEAVPRASVNSLRYAFIGGDVVRKHILRAIEKLAPAATVVVLYGATETQRATGFFVAPKVRQTLSDSTLETEPSTNSLPLGRGMKDVQLLVLNTAQQLAGVGELGEIFVRSPHLAKGYKNDDRLTSERFILNPFTKRMDDRLYKTGDLGRYLPDGEVEYAGRDDDRIKIRGFRVEPIEIESALRQHPAVHDAAVVGHKDSSGGGRLVGYVVPKSQMGTPIAELRRYLKEKLPGYMVPEAFVMLAALPLSPTGKVDRRSLPLPDRDTPDREAEFVTPRNKTEEIIAAIWADVLGVKRVSIHDNFFELGGHSLLAAQLAVRLQEALQIDVPLRRLFETPTVAGLAIAIEDMDGLGAFAQPIDLQAEAVLDENIHTEGVSAAAASACPQHILLTGGTGFLGAFLLHELLERTDSDIFCLVRAANGEQGKDKLQTALAAYGLANQRQSTRIVPVLGDLSRPLLGLSANDFQWLAGKIDTIYHNGAWVNFIYPYQALKAANVLGTREILRLASHVKVKPVHYISTVGVCRSTSGLDSDVVREDDELEHGEWPTGGYEQSKWVAEKLVTLARSRGLPVAIYRPGQITGHSETGGCNTNDLLSRIIKSCILLGSAPTVEMRVDMTPVDFVSKAIIHLAAQASSTGKVFHLVNPAPADVSQMIDWICSFGYPLRKVGYQEWREDLMKFVGNSFTSALFPVLSLFPEWIPEQRTRRPVFDCQNALAGLSDSAIRCPPANARLLHTYLTHFVRIGFLEPPPPGVNQEGRGQKISS